MLSTLSVSTISRRNRMNNRRLGYIQEKRMGDSDKIEYQDIVKEQTPIVYKNKPIMNKICDTEISRLIRKNGLLTAIISQQKHENQDLKSLNKKLDDENKELKNAINKLIKENEKLKTQNKKKKRFLFF